MAQPGLSSSAAKSCRERKPSALKWTVVGVIGAYGAALGLGLFLYRSMAEAPVAPRAATTNENEQVGRIIIHTPDGCRAGKFDNSQPGKYILSPRACDELPDALGAHRHRQPDAIEAIHRYFRSAE